VFAKEEFDGRCEGADDGLVRDHIRGGWREGTHTLNYMVDKKKSYRQLLEALLLKGNVDILL
jgi:hypothetical protein